jgi:predicted Zn finger-like uncharacterized protein
MIVTCDECESSFNVGDSLIKADGSKVRCSKCSSVFVVYPDTSDYDELPELDDMMDFDDDESAIEAADEEASGEIDFDLDEDEDMGLGETGALDEEELDWEAESAAEADEPEQDDVGAVDSDLSDIQMDLDDLDQTEEADMVAKDADLDLDLEPDDEEVAAFEAEGPAEDDETDALDLSDLVWIWNWMLKKRNPPQRKRLPRTMGPMLWIYRIWKIW